MAKSDEQKTRSRKSAKSSIDAAEKDQVALITEDVTPTDQLMEVEASEILELPVLPLRGTVVFPLTVVPLAAGQPRSLRLIDEVMSGDRRSRWSCRRTPSSRGRAWRHFEIGTIANIHQMMRVPDGTVRLRCKASSGCASWSSSEEPYLMARVEEPQKASRSQSKWRRLTRNTLELFQRLVSFVSNLPDELVTAALNIDDPRHLVYLMASNLRMEPEERQSLLELDSCGRSCRSSMLSLARSSTCSNWARRSRVRSRRRSVRPSASTTCASS